MNAKEHGIAGICAGVATCLIIDKYGINQAIPSMETIYTAGSYAAIVASSYIGAFFPDIDQPNSTVGRKVKPISILINKLFGHRGLLHFPLFVALMIGTMYWCNQFIPEYARYIYKLACIGLCSGYVSHIILDMFNPAGVRLLGPFVNFKFKIPTGFTFKKKNKFVTWKYLDGSKAVDKFIANLISVLAVVILYLVINGHLHF